MPAKKTDNIDISSLKYEQAFERLEKTVERMNDPSVPLDELVKLYEQGMALGEHCEKLLSGYEAKMEMIARKSISGELERISGDMPDGGEEK